TPHTPRRHSFPHLPPLTPSSIFSSPLSFSLFFLSPPPPPNPPLFPYTTLSRSKAHARALIAAMEASLAAHKSGRPIPPMPQGLRSEEHTSELQSLTNLVCRLLLEKKKKTHKHARTRHCTSSTNTATRVHPRHLL